MKLKAGDKTHTSD